MKILVTGGSGFLGTHIRRFFDADDFSRRSGFDVLNMQDAERVKDYDVVIHLAALLDKSPDAAEMCFLTNVEGTVNLLRSMNENAVFIFASTKDVYGRFADNYAEVPETCPTVYAGQTALEWSKLIAERYVEFYANQNNFRSCIFRLSTVYAPNSPDNTPNFVTHYADAFNKGETAASAGETARRAVIYCTSKTLPARVRHLSIRSSDTDFITSAADAKTRRLCAAWLKKCRKFPVIKRRLTKKTHSLRPCR